MIDNTTFESLLLSNNIITAEEFDTIQKIHSFNSYELLEFLLKENYASQDQLGKLWGDSLCFAYVNLNKTLFQKEAIDFLPESLARKYSIIPLYKSSNDITIAICNITNDLILNDIEKELNTKVSPVFSFANHIKQAIELQYRSKERFNKISYEIINKFMNLKEELITEEDLKNIAGDETIIKLVDELLLWAIKEQSSDMHIDPFEHSINIRFRIDGVLQEKLVLDKAILPAFISRIKIMSDLNIVEKRKPQDGRITYKVAETSIDIRVAIIPTTYGEKVVLRILGSSFGKSIPDLLDLNLSHDNYKLARKIIDTPNGIFFITGPTGSGKTTSLFSMLKHLNKPEVNILTIEDPVEYKLKGINQVQVNKNIGLDFAIALRSFLRLDPDIILIGEIRDAETARIASQAALTGHLVLATMHTNSSIQAVTRLIEIGVEPFLVAPSVIGVMAQRLVRKICEHCKQKYKPTTADLENYFDIDTNIDELQLYRGKGCHYCNNSGYKGRVAIHEILVIDDETRRMIAKETSTLDIEVHAYDSGFKSMWYDGLKKALMGLTTIEEIQRIIASD